VISDADFAKTKRNNHALFMQYQGEFAHHQITLVFKIKLISPLLQPVSKRERCLLSH
jgi:hypothetical protein